MRKRLSNAMEDGEQLSPPRKKRSLLRPLVFDEQDSDETTANLDYDPIRFLRCHSKTKRDIADLSTQVWYCEFEPSSTYADKTTQYVATCGGNSVCVIDVKAEGPLIERKYFSPDVREMFYSLSWTTLLDYDSNNTVNILAVGGSLGGIHLIHPETDTRFLVHKVSQKKAVISSLKFDKNFPNILYCSSNDQVFVYDIGNPMPPSFNTKLKLLNTLQAKSEIITLALSVKPHVLLAAANDGLYGWESPHQEEADNADPVPLQFVLPRSETAAESGTSLVDSVVCLSNGQVATKCALHGRIYVWDLARTLASGNGPSRKVVAPRSLRWSDTDNYFMNIGFAPGSSLLGCGDDKGMVWVYDLTKNSNEPSVILDWPDTEDPYIAKTKKLRANTYDIVVDKVSFDWSGNFMVAVTSNNMVCIWKRVS